MGWAYAAASSATVLLLSWVAAGADTLHLLFGNVLAVQTTQCCRARDNRAGVVSMHARSSDDDSSLSRSTLKGQQSPESTPACGH